MNIYLQNELKKDPNYIKYLRENSHWYKYLNRNPKYFKEFDREMKNKYRLTPKDKLDKFTKNIDKISQIIDIFS